MPLQKKCPQHPFIIIAHIKKIWVCIMTSLSTTFLELQCQTSHSLTIIAYFSAHLLFYFHFSKSFMPLRFSLNWHIDSCRWVIMLLFFISMFIHFQLLSIILIMKHKLLLIFAFLLSSPCISDCLNCNFSKPIDFDQTVLSWIIYERWFFNLILSNNSSPLWCKY